MCDCDYERPEMYDAGISNAKKTHRCGECGRDIEAGELYERAVGVWAGEFSVFKTCRYCLALKGFVNDRVAGFCWAHGKIRTDAIETARQYSEVQGLLFGAWRREAIIRREAAKRKQTPSARHESCPAGLKP